MSNENYFNGDFEFNSKAKIKKNRKKMILDDLDDLESTTLLSDIYAKNQEKEKKEKEERKNKEIEDDVSDNEWLSALASFKTPKISKRDRSVFKGFDDKKKRKKKKNKNGSSATNYKKDFEMELALLKNLQIEQDSFVDSLQKKYDQMENTKSTARGIGKFTTDLIVSITSARSLSKDLVKEIINTKKTIADLNFKERKEFGAKTDSEQMNLNNYASNYLKQVMSNGRNKILPGSQTEEYITDAIDDEDLFSTISNNLGDTDRSEEAEKYLQYENSGIEIRVVWNDALPDDSDNKYYYVAYDREGNEVSDYPLPEKTKMNINKSTGIATDIYGNKYQMDVI